MGVRAGTALTTRLTRRRAIGIAAITPMLFVAGCGISKSPGESDSLLAWPAEGRWPDIFDFIDPEIQEAYRYAVAHPDELRYMPCFCGCGAQGHTSNYDCYVREVRSDGSVLLDPMSFG